MRGEKYSALGGFITGKKRRTFSRLNSKRTTQPEKGGGVGSPPGLDTYTFLSPRLNISLLRRATGIVCGGVLGRQLLQETRMRISENKRISKRTEETISASGVKR